MTEKSTQDGLFVGFVDYNFCYPSAETLWVVIGFIFFIITLISYIPQIVEMIKSRSSFGISGGSSFSNEIGLFFVSFNVLCFKFADFVGVLQYSFTKTITRLLTFINLFCQCMFYLPINIQIFIFHDNNLRASRGAEQIKSDRLTETLFGILTLVDFVVLLITWSIAGFISGFNCDFLYYIGKVSGIISALLEFCQYVPQFYMTIKLQDNGSLSMLMLKIQAPTNLANALFMIFGQGEDWTTYITSLLDATFEFLLLCLCYFFKWKKALGKKKEINYSEVSMNILEEVKPVEGDPEGSEEAQRTKKIDKF